MGLFGRDSRTLSHQVAYDGATSAQVRVDMAVGDLAVVAGAPGLMSGEFIFDEELAPVFDQRTEGDIAFLSIEQSKGAKRFKSGKNRWDIALTNTIPVDLDVRMSSGRCELDLTQVRVARLHVRHTTGELSVNLGGMQLSLTEVDIAQEAGRTTLDLDGNYALLRTLRVNSTAGEVNVDFVGGAWGQDLDARFDITSGAMTVRLPRDVGVAARITSAIGKVSTSGLQREGDVYRNHVPGSPVTLNLAVRATVGKVALEVGD